MGVEKTGFVNVAISRASPLTRTSVRRVSTDCIVQFIIPGCYLWYWRSWCQGRWTYGWNEQVQIIFIYNYHSLSFRLLHLILVSCNDAACYKCNIRAIICCKIFNSDQNVSHFFSHIHVWSCEAKIFLNFYYFIHWIHMDHGKPGKLCNLRISFSRPGRSWKIMENLTSVWYRYIKSLQMSQHGESISDK